MSYSGGDGQALGIVLTPKHITELFCDLAKLTPDDKVIDPCCGTGGFLIAAMHHMLKQTDNVTEQRHIRQEQLFGIENMDFLKQNTSQLQLKGWELVNLYRYCFTSFSHQ